MTDLAAGVPRAELPLAMRKEQFSLAFVHMVATAAGFWLKDHRTDVDGVDITIASSTEYETYYCPQLELQVKCTSQTSILRESSVAWRMEAGPFGRLTNPKRFCPAYLGVLIVPADPGLWLEQDETLLLTRSRMYWVNARDLRELSDQATTTVHLPTRNLFDVPQLQGIMKTIGDGGDA